MAKGWGVTDKGAVRQQNQDAYYLSVTEHDLALAVVCDGMGGAKAGNVASVLAVDTFLAAIRARDDTKESDPGQILLDAAELANNAVFYRAGIDPDCQGMGTTMVALLLEHSVAHILNIGDSRCYLANGEGITKLTRDHSVVEDLVAEGKITPEEARQHPRKNLITRALGAEEHMRADLYRREMAEGEYLLLCSDGLSNVIGDQEILYEILHGGEPDNCCTRLLNLAMERGAPDNVTAVLLRV